MVVPPKHPKMIILSRKTLVVGYHLFRKPPYKYHCFFVSPWNFPWIFFGPRCFYGAHFGKRDWRILEVKSLNLSPRQCFFVVGIPSPLPTHWPPSGETFRNQPWFLFGNRVNQSRPYRGIIATLLIAKGLERNRISVDSIRYCSLRRLAWRICLTTETAGGILMIRRNLTRFQLGFDSWNPAIYRVFQSPDGAEFLPMTVGSNICLRQKAFMTLMILSECQSERR